jgi:hypothetical protein
MATSRKVICGVYEADGRHFRRLGRFNLRKRRTVAVIPKLAKPRSSCYVLILAICGRGSSSHCFGGITYREMYVWSDSRSTKRNRYALEVLDSAEGGQMREIETLSSGPRNVAQLLLWRNVKGASGYELPPPPGRQGRSVGRQIPLSSRASMTPPKDHSRLPIGEAAAWTDEVPAVVVPQ